MIMTSKNNFANTHLERVLLGCLHSLVWNEVLNAANVVDPHGHGLVQKLARLDLEFWNSFVGESMCVRVNGLVEYVAELPRFQLDLKRASFVCVGICSACLYASWCRPSGFWNLRMRLCACV